MWARALEGSGYPERQPEPESVINVGIRPPTDHAVGASAEDTPDMVPSKSGGGMGPSICSRTGISGPQGLSDIDHYLIQLVEAGYHLQGSARLFPSIPELIAYYCDHKEDLPHKLALPPAVLKARTIKELDSLAMLGQDFWTSAKYDSQSRSSSRSNLSEISSGMNKSQSEPISIKKSTVMAYSQSDAILRDNTPPKHSVIDFSSYLIQKPDRDINFTSVTSACQHSVTQQQDSFHTRCSESGFMRTFHQSKSESKLSSHVSSKTHHLVSTQHVTSKSHVTDKNVKFLFSL
ncbi:uncharacterized protein LOC127859785 [Dreissena polymorpha]|uniref:uncharacterized protein LOC127859785 n=1 Tax=Dreissena polymorpha TaxID=45954 RepID=UPI0022640C26|nr:uncharacterized protein LOC127859785 [Dreissena polymorpha]